MSATPLAAHHSAKSGYGLSIRRRCAGVVAMQRDAGSSGEDEPALPPRSEGFGSLGKMSAAHWPAKPDPPRRPPLTPELLADDVRRNDFMLRAVVVLLAFLLACTTITDSAVLVHIRSGQYMAAQGMLPPRTDVFSATADGEPWVNLAWLFDLAATGVHALGGAAGLSVAKALVAAATFWLVVQIRRPGVPTWWGTICAALALLVCVPQFSPTPELITLLGTAAVLWILHRWRQRPAGRAVWLLVPVVWLWANLDPRAFLGLALLVLYGVGEALAAGGFAGGETASDHRRGRRSLWLAIGASLLVSFVHPFGWQVWTAPAVLYGTTYPAYRAAFDLAPDARLSTAAVQFFPMTVAVFWRSVVNPHLMAGLVLAVAAAVAMLLNRRRLPAAHLLAFLGMAGFAIAGTHELAAASLVWCAVATLNAQEWYRAGFRQTYSLDRGERIFSLGGRVATLLGLLALAYLSISGRLLGAAGPRAGVGFQPALRDMIASLHHALDGTRPGDRGLNFRRDQGDVMIWLGRRPFLDSRLTLYARGGDQSILARFQGVRAALQSPPQSASEYQQRRAMWRATLDDYGIRFALPALTGLDPQYQTFWALDGSPDWMLTRLEAAAAVFYRTDGADPALRQWLAGHRVSFPAQAFGDQAETVPPRPAGAPSASRSWILLPAPHRPNAIQEAMHYDEILLQAMRQAARRRPPVAAPAEAAVAYLALRSAGRGLADDPSRPAAYAVLGDAFFALENIERGWSSPSGQAVVRMRRFLQAVAAYHQAIAADPTGPQANNIRMVLRNLQLLYNNYDLALQMAEQYARAAGDPLELSEASLRRFDENERLIGELRQRVQQGLTAVERQREQQADHIAAGLVAQQHGCVLRALDEWAQVPADRLPAAERVELEIRRALALLQAGRADEAYDHLAGLEQGELAGWARVSPNWRSATALAALAVGQYEQAVPLWEAERSRLQTQRFAAVFDMLPLAAPGPDLFAARRASAEAAWSPLLQMQALQLVLPTLNESLAQTQLQIALCHLETGHVAAAESTLRALLDGAPETALRPLVAIYLAQMSGEFVDVFPPSDRIPIFPGLFAPEPDTDTPQ